MPMIDRAMLAGAFRLIAASASASIHRRVAVDLLQQRIAAIRNPATDDPQRATLADLGPLLPIRMDGQAADPRSRAAANLPTASSKNRATPVAGADVAMSVFIGPITAVTSIGRPRERTGVGDRFQ